MYKYSSLLDINLVNKASSQVLEVTQDGINIDHLLHLLYPDYFMSLQAVYLQKKNFVVQLT